MGCLGVETSGRWAQALLAPERLLYFVAHSSALYASRLYLGQYQLTHPERLAKHSPGGPRIRGTHPATIPKLCPHPSLPFPATQPLCPQSVDSGPQDAEVKSESLLSLNQIWFVAFASRSSLLLLGNVYIHPTAKVAPSAVVSGGPAQGGRWVGQGGVLQSLEYRSVMFVTACHMASSRFLAPYERVGFEVLQAPPPRAYGICSSPQLGPNVSIGEGVTVGEGVRLRESIVLHGATLQVGTPACAPRSWREGEPHGLFALTSHCPVWQEHTCVLHSIVGWGSTVGRWARVEGTPNDPNPNDPHAHMDSESLFKDGKLLPAITILGTASQGAQGCEKPPHVIGGLYGENLCLCEGGGVFFQQTFTKCLLCARPCVSHWGRGARAQMGRERSPLMAVGPSPQLLAPVSSPHGLLPMPSSTLQAAASGSLLRCSS